MTQIVFPARAGVIRLAVSRYIEVIAAHRPPRTIVIFHAMPLSDLFRHLLNEGK